MKQKAAGPAGFDVAPLLGRDLALKMGERFTDVICLRFSDLTDASRKRAAKADSDDWDEYDEVTEGPADDDDGGRGAALFGNPAVLKHFFEYFTDAASSKHIRGGRWLPIAVLGVGPVSTSEDVAEINHQGFLFLNRTDPALLRNGVYRFLKRGRVTALVCDDPKRLTRLLKRGTAHMLNA